MTRFRLPLFLGTAALAIGVPAATAFAAPGSTGPGNNGTVKLDELSLDDTTPGNQPHVGCSFGIDWYGYDAGAETSVEFRLAGGPDRGLLATDAFQLDDDGPAGGGSEAGLDGSRTYTLGSDLHVKVTVRTDTSRGADVKHKVFKTGSCDEGTDGLEGPVGEDVDGVEGPVTGD